MADVKVTPVGSVPVCVTVGVGKPVVVTVKLSAVPTMNVSLLALVIAGGALTAMVKACVAFGSVPLVAVSVTGKDPLCVGVPESSPAADNVRPVGRTPVVTLTVGAGKPVITTWNVVPAVLSRNVAVFALVIAGAWLTVSVKLCTALAPMPLVAVSVTCGRRRCPGQASRSRGPPASA